MEAQEDFEAEYRKKMEQTETEIKEFKKAYKFRQTNPACCATCRNMLLGKYNIAYCAMMPGDDQHMNHVYDLYVCNLFTFRSEIS